MKQNRQNISNPERILRILRRVCESGMQVLIRSKNHSGVAVRARAMQVLVGGNAASGFRVSGVSLRGVEHLRNAEDVMLEFVGLSTQILFNSRILLISEGSITIALPQSITSVERRKNFRVATTQNHAAFISLSIWQASELDAASPPVFPHLEQVASQLRVADISETGVCLVTRFPSPLNALTQGSIDDCAKLRLPMSLPRVLGLEIRWMKRIKETIAVKGESLDQRLLKVGAQFIDPPEEITVSVRQFMRQVSVADAI